MLFPPPFPKGPGISAYYYNSTSHLFKRAIYYIVCQPSSIIYIRYLMNLHTAMLMMKAVWHAFNCNTDWIAVIVQLHWPKQLSHRHFEFLKSRFLSGIPDNIGLIYKSIWHNCNCHAQMDIIKNSTIDGIFFNLN